MAETIRVTGGDREHPIGEVSRERTLHDGRKLHMLWSSKPKSLLYDITHDNPGAMENWNPQAILPLACALAMAHEPIATTHGVDEFYPKNLSVVGERRLYSMLPDPDVPGYEESKEYKGTNVDIHFNGEANKVAVVGTFNNWNTEANPLEKTGPATWKTTMTLNPGKHHFKFFVNGKDWAIGPGQTEKDGGFLNNVIVIEDKGHGMKVYEDLRGVRKVVNEVHALLGRHVTALATYNIVN